MTDSLIETSFRQLSDNAKIRVLTRNFLFPRVPPMTIQRSCTTNRDDLQMNEESKREDYCLAVIYCQGWLGAAIMNTVD
jgi:hypothetical protein